MEILIKVQVPQIVPTFCPLPYSKCTYLVTFDLKTTKILPVRVLKLSGVSTKLER